MNQDLPLLYPLSDFYEQSGMPLPRVEHIDGEAMPQPYRALLVHDRDMTPTIMSAHGQNLRLRLIRRERHGDVYARQIALELEDSGTPVLFGAIKIYLDHFAPHARDLVLEGRRPFGSILQDEAIEHSSRPEAYFQIVSDAVVNEALRLSGENTLYGRRNVLWNASRHPLAQVVEILPAWK